MASSVLKSSNKHAENVKVPYDVIDHAVSLESKPCLVVAIPAYNEEVAIGSVAARCKKYADAVIVVDDGSRDHTVEVAKLVGAEVISHRQNGGYGAAIQSCFEAARAHHADYMVIIDGDGQHDPDDIPLLIAEMKKAGSDIVIGSRFLNGNGKKQHIPAYRKVGMKVLDTATTLGSGIKVSDSQSGFRAYSQKAIRDIDLGDQGMGAGSEILIKAAEKDLRISEVPIRTRYDIKDTSSENPVKHGLGVLGSIFRLVSERRPMLFFGLPGIILLGLGMYAAFTVLAGTTTTGMSILVMFCMVSGTLGVFAALMLTSIQRMIPHQS